jgi:hypothetical protein
VGVPEAVPGAVGGVEVSDDLEGLLGTREAPELLGSLDSLAELFDGSDAFGEESDFPGGGAQAGEGLKDDGREVRSLLRASRELRCNDLLILTESTEREEHASWFGIEGSIRFVPLWGWLTRGRR